MKKNIGGFTVIIHYNDIKYLKKKILFNVKCRMDWYEKKENFGIVGFIVHSKDIKFIFLKFFFILCKMWDGLLWEKGKFWDNKKEKLKKVPWILNSGEKWKVR